MRSLFFGIRHVAGSVERRKGNAMRSHPTALGWVDTNVSAAYEWDCAQIVRLARHLGYALIWPEASLLPLVDLVRAADVDALIVPSPAHLHPVELNAVMGIAAVETVLPRMSFARWAFTQSAKERQ